MTTLIFAIVPFVVSFGCVGWTQDHTAEGSKSTLAVEGSVVESPAKPLELYHRLKGAPPNTNKHKARDLASIFKKATKEEMTDLPKLLSQIDLKRIKQNKRGQTLYSVIRVEKDSVYEREGLKAGDLVWQ